ncbi:MAG TPA: Spo0B domain-containing protein, partial [Candidatus Pullichristensenella excrementigallinarum]|nr:Spo0B domain-containing protein [Candidatus Pullichristensenella excrementigallinarum]
MKRALRERIDISKISKYSIAANAMQILFAFGIFLYALFGREFNLTGRAEQVLVGAMALIVIWGAGLDIRDAFNARKIARQSEMLEEAYGQLEDLNATLRAQRHDFKNHLQVVFGLIELREYQEAQEYIERVYGDVELVGRSLKTAIPAVNALFAAKMADCEEKGIQMDVQI